jgi:hypothetical protein
MLFASSVGKSLKQPFPRPLPSLAAILTVQSLRGRTWLRAPGHKRDTRLSSNVACTSLHHKVQAQEANLKCQCRRKCQFLGDHRIG